MSSRTVAADHEAGGSLGEPRRRHLPDRVDVLLPEAEAEPRVDQLWIGGRDDGIVRRPALLDPARGCERIEVAGRFRLAHGMARRFHPDVRPPRGIRPRRADQVADGGSAACRDRSRRVRCREGLDRGPGDDRLLERGREAGLEQAVGTVALCQQLGGLVDDVRGERMELQAFHRAGR